MGEMQNWSYKDHTRVCHDAAEGCLTSSLTHILQIPQTQKQAKIFSSQFLSQYVNTQNIVFDARLLKGAWSLLLGPGLT